MVAQHCDGRGWRCWQEFTMSSKFRGKYLQVIPLGISHLEFTGSGNVRISFTENCFLHYVLKCLQATTTLGVK